MTQCHTGSHIILENIDILLNKKEPESDCEAFKLAFKFQDKDPKICAKLARMYRDGRGTNPNAEYAYAWFKKHYYDGPDYGRDLILTLISPNFI